MPVSRHWYYTTNENPSGGAGRHYYVPEPWTFGPTAPPVQHNIVRLTASHQVHIRFSNMNLDARPNGGGGSDGSRDSSASRSRRTKAHTLHESSRAPPPPSGRQRAATRLKGAVRTVKAALHIGGGVSGGGGSGAGTAKAKPAHSQEPPLFERDSEPQLQRRGAMRGKSRSMPATLNDAHGLHRSGAVRGERPSRLAQKTHR